jgi:RNA polymerase sigma factor (sigma-70 family)
MNFEEIYKRYYREMHRYAHSILTAHKTIGGWELAKDYAQEAFLSAYKQWDAFKSVEQVKAFLYVATKRRVLNKLDEEKRHSLSHRQIYYLSKEGELPDYFAINAEVIGYIFNELSQLPPQCSKVVKMYFDGFTSQEIASKLHITPKTALNQKLTAIKILKEKLILKFGYM